MRSRWIRPEIGLGLAIGAFVVIGCVTAWWRHENFVTAQYDLGNMDQVLWQTLHGHPFSLVSPNVAQLQPRASLHTDFLLLAYLPAYVLWPDPRVMMFLQTAAVASGAIALWLLARSRLGSWQALALSTAYLLYPPLLWAVSFDVHAIVLIIPLTLWVWWAVQRKRWWVFGLGLLAMILAKEEVGLLVAAMGLGWLRQRETRLAGWVSLIVGLTASAVMIGAVIPGARHEPGHFALAYFAAFGSTPAEVITRLVTHPWEFLWPFIRPAGLAYLWMLVWPLAALPLLGWPILLLSLPMLAINLLSAETNLRSIYFHYTAAITPIMFLAALHGWERLQYWWRVHPAWRKPSQWALGLAALSALWWWAPLPLTRHHQDALRPFRPNPYRTDVAWIKKHVHPEDQVVTTNGLGPHFSRRARVWLFPVAVNRADAVIILLGQPGEIAAPPVMQATLAQLQQDSAWTLIYHRQQLWYFRKTMRP